MMQAYFQILPKENLTDGSIPLYHKVIVDGESPVAICILGDPAYPLLPFVMKEFANNSTFLVSKFYLQCALGRLKGRLWLSQEGYGQRYQVFAGRCPCFFLACIINVTARQTMM